MKDRHGDAVSNEAAQRRATSSSVRLAAIGVIVLVIAAVAYWLLFHGPGQNITSPSGSTILEVSGQRDAATDDFRVREGWSIHWENSGHRFAFAISGDRDFGTVVDQSEPGSGVTSPVGGGTFRLEIEAEGPWSIRVVQGE